MSSGEEEHRRTWLDRLFDRVMGPFLHEQRGRRNRWLLLFFLLALIAASMYLVVSKHVIMKMLPFDRCPPWRAKRRRVVPGSREATRDTRRAEGAKGDPKGASERDVQSYGRPVCSRNELAMLWRNAG